MIALYVKTMNEDINLRIKFIQEVQRHPYLYDHNHVWYNHRDKIEATWKKIGQLFGETSLDCKKKWRLIRCSYTRSLKMQSKQKGILGGLSKGYYMGPHLRFLDPFLKSRSCQDNNYSEDDEISENAEESTEAVDSNSIVQVTLDQVKVEREECDQVDFEETMEEMLQNSTSALEQNKPPSGDFNRSASPSYSSKKIKVHHEEEKKADLTPNQMYLLSLAPFMENMTERQVLTFQKGVVELVEKIKYGP